MRANEADSEAIPVARSWQSILVLIYIALLVGWLALIALAPTLNWNSSFDFQVDRDNGIAILNTGQIVSFSGFPGEHISPNTRAGAIDYAASGISDYRVRSLVQSGNLAIELDDEHEMALKAGRFRLAAPTDSALDGTEFEFPNFPNIVNNRFAVGTHNGSLLVLDLQFPDREPVVAPLRDGFAGDWVIPLPSANSGFAIVGSLPPKGNGGPLFQVRLLKIDSDLKCHELANWLARDFTVFAKFHNVSFTDSHVISLAVDSEEVEFRDNKTGRFSNRFFSIQGTAICNTVS